MSFIPETEIGLGFRCKGQAIYIDEDDVIGYKIDNKEIAIYGKLMSIQIVK
jgi:hypothetical protein